VLAKLAKTVSDWASLGIGVRARKPICPEVSAPFSDVPPKAGRVNRRGKLKKEK
jgi:hypothetical protein